jgi:hypothetical protein
VVSTDKDSLPTDSGPILLPCLQRPYAWVRAGLAPKGELRLTLELKARSGALTLHRNRLAFEGTPGHRAAILWSRSRERSPLPSTAWHSKRRGHTESHSAPTPPERVTGRSGSRCKRSRTAFASRSRCWEYRSVFTLTHRAPGPRRSAGVEDHSNIRTNGGNRNKVPFEQGNRTPNLLADYLYLWKPPQ